MAESTSLETFRASVGQPDLERSLRIREEFRARIATMAPDELGRRPFDNVVPEPTPTVHRPRSQPALALAALAVVLVLAAAAAFLLRERPTAGSFQQLTAAARSQVDVTLDDGQYLYLAERTSANDSATLRQQWADRDGTGQATEAAMTIGPAGSSVPSMTVYDAPGSLEFAGMSYEQLRTLPTDPDALLGRLAELGVARPGVPADQAEAVAAILALHVTPPDVAAAGIQALQIIGGSSIGPVTDRDGRSGVGLRGANGDGTAWLVIIDASSARALAFHPHAPSATSHDSAGRVWTDQGITDSLPRQ
jgi:hypothetical protein